MKPYPLLCLLMVLAAGAAARADTFTIDPEYTIPAFEVKREEFVDSLQFRGEVKATRSVTVSAPAEAGELQILKIATSGATTSKVLRTASPVAR